MYKVRVSVKDDTGRDFYFFTLTVPKEELYEAGAATPGMVPVTKAIVKRVLK